MWMLRSLSQCSFQNIPGACGWYGSQWNDHFVELVRHLSRILYWTGGWISWQINIAVTDSFVGYLYVLLNVRSCILLEAKCMLPFTNTPYLSICKASLILLVNKHSTATRFCVPLLVSIHMLGTTLCTMYFRGLIVCSGIYYDVSVFSDTTTTSYTVRLLAAVGSFQPLEFLSNNRITSKCLES